MAALHPLLEPGDQLVPPLGDAVLDRENLLTLLALLALQFAQPDLDGMLLPERRCRPRLPAKRLYLLLGVLQRPFGGIDFVFGPLLEPLTSGRALPGIGSARRGGTRA